MNGNFIKSNLNSLTSLSFYPSQAKAIAERIVEDELRDQEYEEEDAKVWSTSIADKIREAVKCVASVS